MPRLTDYTGVADLGLGANADIPVSYGEELDVINKTASQVQLMRAAMNKQMFDQRIADLCSNRLVVDQLKALSLRTLRYVRLGFAASPGAVASSLEGWRAFQGAVARRDIPLVQAAAAQRTAAIRGLAVAAVQHA